MKPRLRILLAGAAVLMMVAVLWVFLQWPRWYGTEIHVPVRLDVASGAPDMSWAHFPDSRVQLDATHVLPPPARPRPGSDQESPRINLRSIGVVWNSANDPTEESFRLHNMTVYLQMERDDERGVWHPVSISTALVPGATNIRTRINYANASGHVDVDLDALRVPLSADGKRQSSSAILKVLPSGRHALVGIVIGGERRMF